MLKIELADNNILKTAFESISVIVDEITMTADSTGLHLNALSRDHITFIILDLEKTVFDSFECDKPEKFSIDCSEFMKILKKCKSSDTLELTVDEGNVIMVFKGEATKTFKIRQIDMEYDNPVPPVINFPCSISIESSLLKDYVGDMAIFADKLNFSIDEDYFIINTDADFGDAEVKYVHGESISEYVKSAFSIPRLNDILKAAKFTKNATVNLGDNMPIVIEFKLPTGDGCLKFMLAPRLETEE